MSELLDKLKVYFENNPPEKVKENWDKSAALDLVGPIVEEYLTQIPAATTWKKYTTGNRKTYPPKYGRYLVKRKGGEFKIEIFNGTGWSRDNDYIEFWAEVILPLTD